MAPLGKPMRTYPFGVKIIQGIDMVNSSAKIQFQVNQSIFVGEMNHCVFHNVWHYSKIRMFRTYMAVAVRRCNVIKYCVM